VICDARELRLRGRHNVANVLAACATVATLDVPVAAMHAVATTFAGVAHRLELVAERNNVRYYNDSIATSPERAIAAIESFTEPIVLLLGGRDKDLPWEELAELVCRRVDHVVLFGEAAVKIRQALTAAGAGSGAATRPYSLQTAAALREAVSMAHKVAQAGDVVLLSPGGTSFDEFKDFEERGKSFRTWVQGLT
jgi:UDP-N-acetylmuramoylalanine--D-glutamate ligase